MVATSYGILYLDVEPKSQNIQTPETSCFWRFCSGVKYPVWVASDEHNANSDTTFDNIVNKFS